MRFFLPLIILFLVACQNPPASIPSTKSNAINAEPDTLDSNAKKEAEEKDKKEAEEKEKVLVGGDTAKSKVTCGSWARLLKRVFAIDVSRCPRCKSDLEIIAAVVDPIQIARYLKHTGMPAAPLSRAGVKMRVANEDEC